MAPTHARVYRHPVPPPGGITIHSVADAAVFLQQHVDLAKQKHGLQRPGKLVFTGAAALWAWLYIVLPDGTERDHWQRYATFEDVGTLAGRLFLKSSGLPLSALWVGAEADCGDAYIHTLVNAALEEARQAHSARCEAPSGVTFLLEAPRRYLGPPTPTHNQLVTYHGRIDKSQHFHLSASEQHTFATLYDNTWTKLNIAKLPYLLCEGLVKLYDAVDRYMHLQRSAPQVFRDHPGYESLRAALASSVSYLYILYTVAETKRASWRDSFSHAEITSSIPHPAPPKFAEATQYMTRWSDNDLKVIAELGYQDLKALATQQEVFRRPHPNVGQRSFRTYFYQCLRDMHSVTLWVYQCFPPPLGEVPLPNPSSLLLAPPQLPK
ncbi:hypothetical protein JCM8097_006844 [Rhodosporidiobolus ruineniae]